MEYNEQKFQLDFMQRTLKVVKSYKGPYDATLLLNAMLGLLIVPKESAIDLIPREPRSKFADWGINVAPTKLKFGKCQCCGTKHPETLRQLVKNLRNAVAHFRIKPLHDNKKCIGFRFDDRSGFKAELSLKEMSDLTQKLAEYLEKELFSKYMVVKRGKRTPLNQIS